MSRKYAGTWRKKVSTDELSRKCRRGPSSSNTVKEVKPGGKSYRENVIQIYDVGRPNPPLGYKICAAGKFEKCDNPTMG